MNNSASPSMQRAVFTDNGAAPVNSGMGFTHNSNLKRESTR
jgi:hypothetical protein